MRRRMSRGRRKTPVYWLEDTSEWRTQSLATTVGVIPTTTLSYFRDIGQALPDPSHLYSLGADQTTPVGSAFLTPRTQLLEEPGFRVMRSVGEFTVAIKQEAVGTESAPAAPLVMVTVGLCKMETDEVGNAIDEDDWRLGPQIVPEDDASRAGSMQGEGASWIWRRSWILQNFNANANSAIDTHGVGDSTGALQWGPGTTSGLLLYGMGFSSNNKYQSVHLGAHFDIKRHVTIGAREGLFWRIHAVDMQANPISGFTLLTNRHYRTLIARPGRHSKSFRR